MYYVRALVRDDIHHVLEDALDMVKQLNTQIHEAAAEMLLNVEGAVSYFVDQLEREVSGKLFVGAFKDERLVGLVHYSVEQHPFFTLPFVLETFFIMAEGSSVQEALTLGRESLKRVEAQFGRYSSFAITGNTVGVNKMETLYKRIGYARRGTSFIKLLGVDTYEQNFRRLKPNLH